MEHLLEKQDKLWVCKTCGLNWKRKPRRNCEGIPAIQHRDRPKDTIWDFNLYRNNLTPKCDAKPIAYCHKPSLRHDYCYKLEDCRKRFEEVPDLIVTKQEKDRLGYKTKRQLEKMHLQPLPDARACAVYYWDKEYGMGDFAIFYHPEDTEFCAVDQMLTKTTLKKVYLLSEGWIKKIGEPDQLVDNPRSRWNFIKLYSKKRVEHFLAENAEEYSNWLDKRDKLLQIFEINREKIFKSRNLIREQTKQCMKCKSGEAFEDGFLCAIHPTGLPVEKMPCQDFSAKGDQVYV